MKTYEAKVLKQTNKTKLGIVLLQTAGTSQVLIKSISPGSLVSKTDLVVGLEILSINGESLETKNATEAAKLLSDSQGEVTIKAQGTVGKVKKTATQKAVGVTLKKINGVVTITNISDSGLLASTDIKVGQRLTSINGQVCPPETKDATKKIKDTLTTVELVAIDTGAKVAPPPATTAAVAAAPPAPMEDPKDDEEGESKEEKPEVDEKEGVKAVAAEEVVDGQIVASVNKATKTTPVGLTIGRNVKANALVITKISDKSLFVGSGLKVGQKLVSINNTACPSDMTTKDAVSIIKNTEGELKIVAEDVNGAANVAAAAAVGTAAAAGTAAAVAASKEEEEPEEKPEETTSAEDEKPEEEVKPEETPEENEDRAAVLPAAAAVAAAGAVAAGAAASDSPLLEDDGIVTAIANKATSDSKVGIRMKNRSGSVVISNIAAESLFADSALMVGMKVVTINGNPCAGGAFEAVQLIKGLEGPVTIVAKKTVATATKPTKESRVGISFGKHKNGSVVLLSNTGLFADSDLEVGQVIVSINGQDCPDGVQDAVGIIKESVGPVTIVAVENVVMVDGSEFASSYFTPREVVSAAPVVGRVVASVTKERKSSFGISMWSAKDDPSVYISKIDPEGVFFGTDLRIGQKVVSINGTPCPATAKDAIAMVKASGNQLTVVASYMVASVKKEDANTKLGLVLGQMENHIIVYKITSDSLFKGSDVRLGQTVASINEEKCPSKVQDAIAMLTKAASEVTVFTVKSFPPQKIMFPESSWVTETRSKDSDARFGLYMLTVSGDSPRVVISKISPESPFADSQLMVGQTVISINGQKCPNRSGDAVELMKSGGNTATITAASVVAVVKKPAQHASVGLTLAQVPGYVSVLKVAEGGLFSNTFLKEGQKVLSINDEDLGNDVSKASSLIRDAGEFVKVVAVDPVVRKSYRLSSKSLEGRVSAVIEKDSKDTRVGFGVINDSEGHVFVSNIAPDGLLAKSQLHVGQKIVSINNIPCPETTKDTMDIIRGATGMITIVAMTIEGQVAVAVEKESKETRVGLAVIRSNQGHIVVSNIAKDGLLADSPLEPGQRVISINHQPCPETTKATMNIIREAEGKITIVAASTVAKAEKADKEHKVGLGLAKLGDGSIVVYKVEEGCLFDLEVGQKLVSINGEPCPDSLDDTMNLLDECEGPMKIVALDTIEKEEEEEVAGAECSEPEIEATPESGNAESSPEPEESQEADTPEAEELGKEEAAVPDESQDADTPGTEEEEVAVPGESQEETTTTEEQAGSSEADKEEDAAGSEEPASSP